MAQLRPIDQALLPLKQIPRLESGEKYHAFISHSSKDVDYSHFLKEQLEGAGLKCFHSDDDFTAGRTIVANIMEGINQSRRVITIISENMMESSWVEFEVANSRAKSNEKKMVTFIPILYKISPDKVPAYVKEINYLVYDEPKFWSKLLKDLTEDTPLDVAIPAGNIAHGISWSYFYGYLAFVLPGLVRRTMDSEFAKKGIPILAKMVIVLPETCNCPSDVKKVDENVTHEGGIKFKASRAGKIGRDYTSSVFKVKDPENGEEFYTIMEYATPLLAMYEMEQGRIANLDSQEKFRQMMLFKEKMEEILRHPSNQECRDKAVLVHYKDRGQGQQRLAKVLADTIRKELARQSGPEPMEQ